MWSAVFFALASASQASASLGLMPGDMVTISVDRLSGGLIITERGRASDRPMTYMEATGTAAMLGLIAPGETMPERDGVVDTLPMPRDAVRLTLKRIGERPDTLLIVENGYGERFTYKAKLTLDGRSPEATSVCDVPSGKTSFEHWPYSFVALTISGAELGTTTDPAPVTCK